MGEGASEEFEVKVGLRQSSVLRPLLFIAVLDLISRKTEVKDAMKKLLYADDLALVANGKQELQQILEEWNSLFTRHGLIISLEKTEVIHISHQREELDIELEGKKLTQRDSFVYLGGAVCEDGKTERERYVESTGEELQSYVRTAGGDEGGQGWEGRTVLREMWRRQEEDWKKTQVTFHITWLPRKLKRQRGVDKTIRWGGEEVSGSTSPRTKWKRGREQFS